MNRTDKRGIFNITVPELEYVLYGFDSIPCKAVVRISFDGELCPALADKVGYLVSELKSVGKANGLLELEPSGWSVQPCWLEA
ncbi:Unknown protein [Striga hermonthica]|uniref:Uncharacterized protein n=1 Tax=Striga hermonthica TaxID=68872 RepID=A0A9N7RJ47_STRHE|nr:Unknown protein [Striga hermonthica]